MSIETLPHELLVKIFSHLNWISLRDLTLVNRRWNQVIGQLVTLQMSKSVLHWQQESAHSEICTACIPLEVLGGSSRDYRKFSCSLCSEFETIRETIGPILDYCHQRWHMNALRIESRYEQFVQFLGQYRHLLKDVVRTDISVLEYPSTAFRYETSANFVLPMENLQRLHLFYEASSFCSLSIHAPKLEFLTVERYLYQNNVRLTIPDSTKLRSVLIRGKDSSQCSSGVDPIELESILPQTRKTTRVEIWRCSIATTYKAMFGYLQTIILRSVTLTPTDNFLECLHLKRLELQTIMLQKPLKLRVPKLITLICDSESLQSLRLKDAFKADLLETDWRSARIESSPVGLSSFRRLHLMLWSTERREDDISIGWFWPYLGGITELKVQSKCGNRYFHGIKKIWKHLPQLNSLRLLGMEVPDDFKSLPANVQNVSIKDCSIQGSKIAFPSTVERVRVEKLWKRTENASDVGVVLLPPNRYPPLKCEIIQVEHNYETVSRTIYSTKGCSDWKNSLY